MIIKINGKVINDDQQKEMIKKVSEGVFTWEVAEPVETDVDTETLRERVVKVQSKIRKRLAPVVAGVNLLAAAPVNAMANNYNVVAVPAAATGSGGIGTALTPIISMLQELALPVGIGMAIWGLIEIIIGNPGGKDKIRYSILGYIGCFIIPFFFYQIRAGLTGLGGI